MLNVLVYCELPALEIFSLIVPIGCYICTNNSKDFHIGIIHNTWTFSGRNLRINSRLRDKNFKPVGKRITHLLSYQKALSPWEISNPSAYFLSSFKLMGQVLLKPICLFVFLSLKELNPAARLQVPRKESSSDR